MKFGQYELLERVAVGGMAEVYRGRVAGAEGFEKWVAIKRILPEFARDERFISMMLTEARIHSALSHRNIVQIHDLGISEDGEYFIVLEYVEGHDLRAVMEAASELGVQIPDSLALHVADELAQALHFAHELTDPEGQPLGIIHRDVSPSNVLISNSGEVKLSDFGIAKRRHDHSFVGSLKGNLVYMSPEQARRVPLDRRTDVFSLGAVLFEMLTGQKVREITDDVSGFRDVASGVVRSARAVRPDLPEAYEALLARALASNPGDRFPDAAAFGAAIRELARENAPVGPADMKELIELLNPPRRARSPVERSKVIRLGPEFKALAGQARGAKANGPGDGGADQGAVILAPGVVPVRTPPTAPAPAPGNGNGSGNGGPPGARAWSDPASSRLTAATPDPDPAPAFKPTPPPLSAAMEPTPPPPIVVGAPGAAAPAGATGGGVVGASVGRHPGQQVAAFDAAEAALHALEFSAGNEMLPTPPPPAVQGPYAPEIVTPVATPRPAGRRPVPRPAEQATTHQVGDPARSGRIDVTAREMALSAPTPPPRTNTASYTAGGLNGSHDAHAGEPRQPTHRQRTITGGGPARPGNTAPFGQQVPARFAPPATFTPSLPRRGSWLSRFVVLLVLLAAAAAVVHYKFIPLNVLAVWSKPATLSITSSPSGASVTLDGRPLPEQTPTHAEVRRDRGDHVLQFARAGSLPVRTVVRFDRKVVLLESVTLPAEPAPPPPPPAPPAPPPAPVAAAEPPPPPQPKKLSKRELKAARKAAKLSAKGDSAKAGGAKVKASGKKTSAKQVAANKKKAKKKVSKTVQKKTQKKAATSSPSEL